MLRGGLRAGVTARDGRAATRGRGCRRQERVGSFDGANGVHPAGRAGVVRCSGVGELWLGSVSKLTESSRRACAAPSPRSREAADSCGACRVTRSDAGRTSFFALGLALLCRNGGRGRRCPAGVFAELHTKSAPERPLRRGYPVRCFVGGQRGRSSWKSPPSKTTSRPWASLWKARVSVPVRVKPSAVSSATEGVLRRAVPAVMRVMPCVRR